MRSRIAFFPAALTATALLLTGCSTHGTSNTSGSSSAVISASPSHKLNIYLLPKQKGIPYFTSCDVGAQEAAKDLGDVNLVYDGPTDGAPDKAASLIQTWTLKGANAICVSPNNPDVLAPAMKNAEAQGVHVLTWDADGLPGTREFFVNQATAAQIGDSLVDTMVKDLGQPTGQVAIVTATLTAANQNAWIAAMKVELKKYPGLQLVATVPSNDQQDVGQQVTQDLMKTYPNLRGIFAISSAAFPGAAEAIEQAGKQGKVLVTGLSTPNDMKKYVMDGTVKSVVLWNTQDLGYLTIYAAEAAATGKLKPGMTSFKAGRLGVKKIVGDNILLGGTLVFTKANINQYNF